MNETLTRENYLRIDTELDQCGVFAKQYTRMVGKHVVVVGMRIGVKPNHMVALFGDTIVRGRDGSYTVIGGGQ